MLAHALWSAAHNVEWFDGHFLRPTFFPPQQQDSDPEAVLCAGSIPADCSLNIYNMS